MSASTPHNGIRHDGIQPEGIRLEGVAKTFGRNQVLRDVTADLPAGRIYGLLGSNGVGKTTLMSLICGNAFLTGGRILIDGEVPLENADILQRICFVREDQRYNDMFSVDQILDVAEHFYPSWSPDTAARLGQRFRLPRRTRSKKLSRGQRSALAITIALASRAPYTFLDEPYLGLDASARSIFYDELLVEYAAQPRTVIMSTHLIDEAADLMEEVIVLENGIVALQADVEQARHSAFVVRGRESEVAALVGAREVLTQRRLGSIVSTTVRGEASASDRALAQRSALRLEPASLQDFVAALGIHALDAEHPGSATSRPHAHGSRGDGTHHGIPADQGDRADHEELVS